LQAAAAIGQARLIGLYRRCFAAHGLPIGQVLLTHGDLRSRHRHLNARNTFSRLLSSGCVPIVNENDTVAVDEIRFGDNDLLSALVAMLVRADLLVMLTTVDGLHDRPPEQGGAVIDTVSRITERIHAMAGGAASAVAVGGMRTKVQAAEMVTQAGEFCVIANGRRPRVISHILAGERIGTVFEPGERRMAGRKRWIAFFDHPRGELHVDEGAAAALCHGGRSLLAVGITSVVGRFGRGTPVRIIGPDGQEIARGLVNYDAEELGRIAGLQTGQVVQALGGPAYGEVVHRDNLVLRSSPDDA
jgi:glutamate 5-kinase